MNTLIKIWQYKYQIIILVLVISSTFLYVKNNALKKQLNEEKIDHKITKQNFQAYKDSINQVPDSLQIYHVFVKDLQKQLVNFENDNNIKTEKIALLNNKIIVLQDSILFLNDKIGLLEENIGTDSASYTMKINGENEVAKVDGFAKFFPVQHYGKYKLKFITKEMEIQNFLTYNLGDTSIISYAQINNGKKILASSTISPDLYKLISTGIEKEEFSDKLRFGLSGAVSTNNFSEYQLIPEAFTSYQINNFDIKLSSFYFEKNIYGKASIEYSKSLNEILRK